MIIRKARQADIPAMANLWANLVLEENPKAVPQKAQWMDLQRNLMKLSTFHAYVMDLNGMVMGFATGLEDVCMETGDRYLEGLHMYVSPLYRKGQAGRELHRMGTTVAKAIGAKFFRRHVNVMNERMMKRLQAKGHVIREYTVDEPIGEQRWVG